MTHYQRLTDTVDTIAIGKILNDRAPPCGAGRLKKAMAYKIKRSTYSLPGVEWHRFNNNLKHKLNLCNSCI
jgi:hypothetical protein